MNKVHLCREMPEQRTFYFTACGIKFLASGKVLNNRGRYADAVGPYQWARTRHGKYACKSCLKKS